MTYRRRFRTSLITGAIGALLAFYTLSRPMWVVALLLLLFAVAQLAVSIRDLRRHRHGKSYLRHAALVYGPHAVVAILLALGLRVWLVLAPPAPTPISHLPPEELRARIREDIHGWVRRRETSAACLEQLRRVEAASQVNPEEIRRRWHDFLAADEAHKRMMKIYQGFHHIDAIGEPRLHADAFILGLSEFSQHLLLLSDLAQLMEKRPHLRDLLDQHHPALGRYSCSRAIRALASDRHALRLHAGYAYLQMIEGNCSPANPVLPVLDEDLRRARGLVGKSTWVAIRDPLRQLRMLSRQPIWAKPPTVTDPEIPANPKKD